MPHKSFRVFKERFPFVGTTTCLVVGNERFFNGQMKTYFVKTFD